MGRLHRRGVARSLAATTLVVAMVAAAPAVWAAPGGRSKAALQITPTQYGYGDVPIGAASAPFTFTVTNTGGAATGPVSWSITGRYGTDFTVASGGGGACTSGATTLAAGGSCTIAVAFAPTSSLGKKSATLNVADGPGTGSPKATLAGNAVAPATLTLTPTAHDFGQVTGGHGSFAYAFTVTNSGSATSGPISFGATGTDAGDFFVVSGQTNGCVSGATTLTVGTTCTIDVSFMPSDLGPFEPKSATLQVSTSNSYEGAPSAALSGESTPPDVLSISPTSFDFGEVAVGTTSTTTFTVTNTGSQTSAEVHTAVSGADQAEFTIGGLTDFCTGPTLTVGSSCTFAVTFAPTSAGPKSAAVEVWTAKTNFNSSATLAGNAATAGCTIGPDNGCVTLDGVVVQQLTDAGPPPTYGTRYYTLTGTVGFSPTCQAGSAGCDYSNYQDYFTGSGTFSLYDGTGTVSGTWTASFYSAGQGPQYMDASLGASDCGSAAIVSLLGILHFTDGTSSWQTNYIRIRTDTAETGPYKNMVYMDGVTGPSGAQGTYHTSDMSGVAISC